MSRSDDLCGPLASGETPEPARRLAAEYSGAAVGYASHWAPVLIPMAGSLLRGIPLSEAARILDIGCGTGDLMCAVRANAPEARVLGVDRAAGMLAVARRRIDAPLAVMTADRLALRDSSIDVALLAFVLHHLTDPEAALRETHRVLRPAGMVGLVVWGKRADIPGSAIWQQVLDDMGTGPDLRDPAVMNHARMDTLEKLSELVATSGLRVARAWREVHSLPWTPRSLLDLQSNCGPSARRLAGLSETARAMCRARVGTRLAALHPDELVYRPEVLYAVAERSV